MSQVHAAQRGVRTATAETATVRKEHQRCTTWSLMRHCRSECNAVLIEVKEPKSLLYFPDNNQTTWRWSKAFVRVEGDWQIPDPKNCWSCGVSKDFSGYMWWLDEEGRVWKVGGNGDPKAVAAATVVAREGCQS